MNTPVAVYITAEFTNRKNKYKKFSKILIYQVAFVNQIEADLKMTVIGTTNDQFDTSEGSYRKTMVNKQSVRYDASGSFIKNWEDEENDPPELMYQWVCPSSLQKVCSAE
jgi:hypothetical protein